MDNTFEGLLAWSLDLAPKIGVGIAVFAAFWISGGVAGRLIRRVGEKTRLDRHVANLLSQIAKVALVILGVISALGTMGIDVSAMVASLGLLGFAVGFALKDALSNMLAGVLILVYEPFEVNDRIAVAGIEGDVVNIDLRYTTVKEGGKTVLIPNSTLFTKPITIISIGEHDR